MAKTTSEVALMDAQEAAYEAYVKLGGIGWQGIGLTAYNDLRNTLLRAAGLEICVECGEETPAADFKANDGFCDSCDPRDEPNRRTDAAYDLWKERTYGN